MLKYDLSVELNYINYMYTASRRFSGDLMIKLLLFEHS